MHSTCMHDAKIAHLSSPAARMSGGCKGGEGGKTDIRHKYLESVQIPARSAVKNIYPETTYSDPDKSHISPRPPAMLPTHLHHKRRTPGTRVQPLRPDPPPAVPPQGAVATLGQLGHQDPAPCAVRPLRGAVAVRLALHATSVEPAAPAAAPPRRPCSPPPPAAAHHRAP